MSEDYVVYACLYIDTVVCLTWVYLVQFNYIADLNIVLKIQVSFVSFKLFKYWSMSVRQKSSNFKIYISNHMHIVNILV